MADLLSGIDPRIRSVIRLLTRSQFLTRAIVYYLHTEDRFNEGSGQGEASMTPVSLGHVARAPHSIKSASALQGSGIQVGDPMYLILVSDFAAWEQMSLKDEILDTVDNARMKVLNITQLGRSGVLVSCQGAR
jgi:hypothetical protein